MGWRAGKRLRFPDHSNPKKLIVAAGECAQFGPDEHPPPPELKLAWQTREYGVLPEAGGLRDQPAGLLDRMDAAYHTHRAVKAWARAFYHGSGSFNQWAQKNEDVWRVVKEYHKYKEEFDNGP